MDQPVITRRGVLEVSTAFAAAAVSATQAQSADSATQAVAVPDAVALVPVQLTINGSARRFSIDPRTTLLDLVREHAGLTGSKKGCDHGQCGACTVLLEGRRINACLSLAVMHDGEHLTTIEGLAQGDALHPMQAAFLQHDGFQCGYCTPGQICSAIGLLDEARAGLPSAVSADLATGDFATPGQLTGAEIRERMSGNICRCSAYPNIVAAISEVAQA